jgi:hypothetical protein
VFDQLSMHHAYRSQEALEVISPTDLNFRYFSLYMFVIFSAFLLAMLHSPLI